jgi:GMP synthase-like glutamine amidotransferase
VVSSACEAARRPVIGLTTYSEPARMLVWQREFAMLHAVSCHHHQALARLAPGLKVTGRADDGTVEVVEVSGRAFAVGVQWHPEESSADVRLFTALVNAGQRYRERLREGVS